MCGIAGWLGDLPNGDRYAAHMVEALRHRGPDGHGIQSFPEATLVHTRLSIIDLTQAGAQPLANEDGTCHLRNPERPETLRVTCATRSERYAATR